MRFTSGYAEGMVEGHELSADDEFLPKPFDQSELTAAIRVVLSAAPAS